MHYKIKLNPCHSILKHMLINSLSLSFHLPFPALLARNNPQLFPSLSFLFSLVRCSYSSIFRSFVNKECSVWIQSKLLEIRRCERGNFCIMEKSGKFLMSLFFGREVMVWFDRAVEECFSFRGEKGSLPNVKGR